MSCATDTLIKIESDQTNQNLLGEKNMSNEIVFSPPKANEGNLTLPPNKKNRDNDSSRGMFSSIKNKYIQMKQ